MGLRVLADPSTRRYSQSRVVVDRYRGYEPILAGRDVRDAVYVSSRACGYHGGQHAIASVQAVEMAYGIEPPPMAVALRNLGLSAEMVHAEAAHLVLLAAPDLSRAAVAQHWPSLLGLAQRTPAPHANVHGFKTMADCIGAFDPLTGRWYRDAFAVARIPFAMYSCIHGKYPHPQTIIPGGVGTTMSHTTASKVHDYVVQLLSLVDPAKRIVLLVEDILDWYLETVPEIAEIGAAPMNFIDSGLWDDCEGYDPSWEGLSERGNRRYAAPGVVINGQLVTSDLREVAEGVEEDVPHSFFSGGSGRPFERRTVPALGPRSWSGRYSWSTSARWRGHAVETGPGARLWTTALRGRMQINHFMSAREGGVQLLLPTGGLPELLLDWRPPQKWNAIERTRGRLYGIVFAALNAAVQGLKVLELQKESRHQTSVPLNLSGHGQRRGVGFSGDGLLGHWLETDGKTISNYQIVGPSTFNIGPGGPAEAAIDSTPMLAATESGPGIEALIALRSFDPCTNCGAH